MMTNTAACGKCGSIGCEVHAEQIEAGRRSIELDGRINGEFLPPGISDRAARTLAALRSLTLGEITRTERRFQDSGDDRRQLADLDEVIRACGRNPETIGRLL